MSSNPVAITCCYICKKSNSTSLRRWESKTGCSTCRNYFSLTFDSAYKATNEIPINNIKQDISNENGKIMSIFWDLINSKSDCLRVLNCQDFSKLCIHESYPISRCRKCKFRKMFFIFSLPCTKNAKSNLSVWIRIKESWSFIKCRLKERISENEMIEEGERDGMNLVRDELYPMKDYFAEKRSKSVAKHDEKSRTDLENRVTGGRGGSEAGPNTGGPRAASGMIF